MRMTAIVVTVLFLGGCEKGATPGASAPRAERDRQITNAEKPPADTTASVAEETAVEPRKLANRQTKRLGEEAGALPADGQAADEEYSDPAAQDFPYVDFPAERFLVYTGGGPLVIDAVIVLDGRSHIQAMEDLVEHVLSAADENADGKATWEELLEGRRFRYGQFGNLPFNTPADKQQIRQLYDVNQNGIVDPSEVPRFATRNAGSSRPFSLRGSNLYRGRNKYEAPIRRLLDTDGNGELNTHEIERAPVALDSRDADGDGILYREDLTDQPDDIQNALMQRRRYGGPDAARLLDGEVDWNAVLYELEEIYAYGRPLSKDSMPAFPDLFDELDADGDDAIDAEELAGLAAMAPHLSLLVEFVVSGDENVPRSKIRVLAGKSDLPREVAVTEGSSNVTLKLADLELEFYVNDLADDMANSVDSDRQFQAVDGDKNGYLDEEEYRTAPQSAGIPFEAVDEDENGKVFPEELLSFFKNQRLAQRCQAHARAADEVDAWFAVLDANDDGRLTPREIGATPKQLTALDTDQDGTLRHDDVPDSIAVAFARGSLQQENRLFARPPAGQPAVDPSLPRWFLSMDQNGDGEISPREFLGTSVQFERLDVDSDGYIEPVEAAPIQAAAR